MKRGALILAGIALVALALTAGASADPPTRTVSPAADEFSIEGLCDFTVLAVVEGTIIETKFTDEEGAVVRETEVYPAYKLTLTNDDTDESIVVVIPGPEFIRHDDDGQTRIGTGPWLFGDNPKTGEAGLFLVRGRWVETAAGTTFVGNVVDLCAKLAA